MKVLLLGATGLLGHNVLRQLADGGHGVVALVRRAGGIGMEGPWEVREGSPLDYGTLRAAAEGCDAVINCIGTTDMSLRHYEDYLPANRDLCRLLVRLLEEMPGVRVLVHTSTVNTIGYGTAAAPADERNPMEKPFLGSYYADSKREGEVLLLEAASRLTDRHIVVVNPGFMLGAWDAKPSSGRMLLAAYGKPLMFAPKGGKAFVHVQDVAQALIHALERGRSGGRYIAVNSHACLTIRELYRLQAEICGYRQTILSLPDWLLLAAGRVGDLARALGLKTEVSTRNVKQLMVREYYDNHLAVSELGMQETPVAQAIEDFHQWRNKHTRI
ncbi:MAG: NAD-dependent epimerase/dehydratase family protein [Bacteroidales bacterium]|nr:NAD-dependent epimerase/dehydratase family protein [Bacteroidales bacterium]